MDTGLMLLLSLILAAALVQAFVMIRRGWHGR